MGNLRQKYRIAGCPELTVNRKRSAGQGTRKMKKAKRSKINFLPDFPQGRTPNSLEDERITLQDEIAAEFMRLVSADLHKSFLDGLDRYLPRLLKVYKARGSRVTELHSLLESLDSEATDSEEAAVKGVQVGVLIVTEEGEQAALPKNIVDVAVIMEEHIVLRELRDVSNGFAVLMGFLYSLNIDYPKGLKYTFEVIQKIIMDIGGGTCCARAHGLRNKLLQRTI
ncbi:hypothetical protein SKAU_G00245130 [Synaphobranchus kaupii]|uniref:Uncharacterized protein n=1 Tax=Synaphobranchus kaupii TaxID=118154 RepID=A0A9Q1F1Q4_SYNKA|nr:hypothetical protein SKAU_G00245130 [Synaphobranchus kaupii]